MESELEGCTGFSEGVNVKFVKKCISIITCTSLIALGLVGCMPNDKEIISKSLDNTFAKMKSLDAEFVNSIENSPSGSDMTELGINSAEFLSAFLEGMSYEIGEIKVDGNTATAQLSVTSKRMSEIITNFDTSSLSYIESVPISNLSDEELQTDLTDILFSETKNTLPVTSNHTLDFELSENIWALTESSQKLLEEIVFGTQAA